MTLNLNREHNSLIINKLYSLCLYMFKKEFRLIPTSQDECVDDV
ncbi:MAG: hypothetical protein RIS64_970 [Bacteroidota bacterium]|jgi:hypothetical protein